VLLGAFCFPVAFAAADLMITGIVSDSEGKPIANAIVMVYHAGPTTGYSLFCPSCYADCGKRAITDSNGMFAFHHLSADLWFDLLVASSGYEPKFVEKVVPRSDLPVATTLGARPEVSDSGRIFRGRIVDSSGLRQRDAVVQLLGELWNTKTGPHSSYHGGSATPGLDPVAVTDGNGDFEIDAFSPGAAPLKILVSVEARGMAQTLSVIHAGLDRQATTVTPGAVVRGRLVQGGKPVGGVEVGLFGNPPATWRDNFEISGNPYPEIRIGTRPDGTFEITGVPVPEKWYVYAKMQSVATRGATGSVACVAKRDNEVVDVGDLELKPAYHLRGRVVLSDDQPIANGMKITVKSEKAFDFQTATLPPNGRFEFVGLAAGNYLIWASVKGYSPPPMAPVSSKDKDGRVFMYTPGPPPVPIEHDVDDFVIKLHPDK